MARSTFGKDLELLQEVLATGRNAGMTKKLWTKLARDERLFSRAVSYLKLSKPTTDLKIAQGIMRENFLGPKEVAKYLHIRLSKEEQEAIKQVPFSQITLFEHMDTHLLVLGVPHDNEGEPLTIHSLAKMFHGKPDGKPGHLTYCWENLLEERFFTEETCELRWYLISKHGYNTTFKDRLYRGIPRYTKLRSYQGWVEFLKKEERFGYIEKAVVYYYTMVLWHQVTDGFIYGEYEEIWTASCHAKPDRGWYRVHEQVVVQRGSLYTPFHHRSWTTESWHDPDLAPACRPDG